MIASDKSTINPPFENRVERDITPRLIPTGYAFKTNSRPSIRTGQ